MMPGFTEPKEVPDDVKQFLRSILVSKKGVKQSRVEHDYKELVGESLPWRKLGFKSLFDFLMSLPDVTKLEWRENDEENRVFAVLDKNAFASLHAKRMSERGFGQGTKPRSPKEIAEWKARRRQPATKPFHHSSSAPAIVSSARSEFNTPPLTQACQAPSSGKIVKEQQGLISVTFRNDGLSMSENGETENESSSSEKGETCFNVDMREYEDKMTQNLEGLYSLCINLISQTARTSVGLHRQMCTLDRLWSIFNATLFDI